MGRLAPAPAGDTVSLAGGPGCGAGGGLARSGCAVRAPAVSVYLAIGCRHFVRRQPDTALSRNTRPGAGGAAPGHHRHSDYLGHYHHGRALDSRAALGTGVAVWLHYGGYGRSEEHTSELQSLMRISYAFFCLKKKKHNKR